LIIGKWFIFGWQNNKWKKEFASGSASTLNNMALSKDGAFATPESCYMAAWELIIFDHDD
jgi:hypothetical protein